MANLKELRTRKKSVQATQKITSAMKMVAGAKLRRFHQQFDTSKGFYQSLYTIVARLMGHIKDLDTVPFFFQKPPLTIKNHLLIVVSSNRGLCGGFNTTLFRYVRSWIHRQRQQGITPRLLCVGRKVRDLLKAEFRDLILEDPFLEGIETYAKKYVNVSFTQAEKLVHYLLDSVSTFDLCSIMYMHFKTALAQEVNLKQLLPFDIPPHPEGDHVEQGLYLYEPTLDDLCQSIMPLFLATQIYQCLVESGVSEQGARMMAMDNATRNANDMIKKLELTYNRTRQAYITKELIEIISGSEAV